MECRSGCGACCIAPSISSPMPGMANGKPAGMPCIHLVGDYQCALFNSSERPKVCAGFQAEFIICGYKREEALTTLTSLL